MLKLRPNNGSSGQRLCRSRTGGLARNGAIIARSLAGPAAAAEPSRWAASLKFRQRKGETMNDESLVEKASRNRRKEIYIAIALILIIVFAWILIRPGVFTIQPIGAIPEGITIIYHSRNPEMPFFSSPDGLCLQIQGSVSLLCRLAALSAVEEISDRIILRLPYSHWAYLQSTGGLEFEK